MNLVLSPACLPDLNVTAVVATAAIEIQLRRNVLKFLKPCEKISCFSLGFPCFCCDHITITHTPCYVCIGCNHSRWRRIRRDAGHSIVTGAQYNDDVIATSISQVVIAVLYHGKSIKSRIAAKLKPTIGYRLRFVLPLTVRTREMDVVLSYLLLFCYCGKCQRLLEVVTATLNRVWVSLRQLYSYILTIAFSYRD